VIRAPAHWFPHVPAAGLCAGLAVANLVRPTSLAVPAAACVVAAAAAFLEPAGRAAGLACALLLAGWWWGGVRLDDLDRSVLRSHAGETARATVVVTGPVRQGTFALRVPAKVRRFGGLVVDEPVLLMLPLGRAPPQGGILELTGRIELPRPADEGFDEQKWLRRLGVAVVLHGANWRPIGRRGGLGGLGDRLRSHLERTIAPGLGGERRAVVAGVVLGADEGLTQELRDAFRASGLYHLLAVSGQNVAFIAFGVLAAAWLAGVPRWLGEVAVLAAIGGYVLAVGWQPSVVRAGVAGAVASLAWLAARPRDRWYILLLGAIVLLAWNPYALLEPGFQLSFAAVAAIFVAVPRLMRRLEGYPLPRKVAAVIAVASVCGTVTAPILWFHFGSVPVYSVPANALGAPVVAPLLGLGLIASALEPALPGAAAALGWANGWAAAYLAACARAIGALPGAELTSGRLLLAFAGAIVVALMAARLDRAGRQRLLVGGTVVAVVGGMWSLAPRPPSPPPEGLRITFLDVGQGDATLVQVPEGAVLIDQGPPEARVADQLLRLGMRRLAMLVLTHPSRDNIGGAEEVVRRLQVDLVLHPELPFEDPFGRPALAEARGRAIPVRVARAGSRFSLGRLRLAVLWPRDGARRSDDPNDHATVLLVSYGALDALLPADAESNVTLPLRLGPVEVLKVGHHGSSDSRLLELVRTLRPEVAVISVGARNGYGHPAPSTLAALAGVRLYRTDLNGRVTLESDGRALGVRSER
jgi:competence protein ComEC